MRLHLALVLTAAMFVAGGRARADACSEPSACFMVLRGELVSGQARGAMVLTSDASDTRLYLGGAFRHHSLARIAWRDPVRVPFEVSFDWQFLTPGRWALELDAAGVVMLLSPDRLGFFIDDAQMMGNMFDELPGVGGPDRRRITVRRTASEIVVLVENKEVGRKAVPAPLSGTVVLGLRGAPAHRSRAVLRSFAVRPLP